MVGVLRVRIDGLQSEVEQHNADRRAFQLKIEQLQTALDKSRQDGEANKAFVDKWRGRTDEYAAMKRRQLHYTMSSEQLARAFNNVGDLNNLLIDIREIEQRITDAMQDKAHEARAETHTQRVESERLGRDWQQLMLYMCQSSHSNSVLCSCDMCSRELPASLMATSANNSWPFSCSCGDHEGMYPVSV